MHTRDTFETNRRSLSGTDVADGFALMHRTLELDIGRNETSRISMICVQGQFFNCFTFTSTIIKTNSTHTQLTTLGSEGFFFFLILI